MISIIMSTYNSESTLDKAINSILSQTERNFEFLIMDDGSKDRSKEILDTFSNKDKRIKIFKNNKNLGLTESLNYLVKESKFKIIARQDADDYSHPLRLEKQLKTLKNTKYSICTTRAKSMQTNKKIPGISYFLPNKILLNYKNPFVHGTLMMDKEVFFNVGGYDNEFKFSQDYKLFLDIYEKGYKVKTLNEVLYYLNTINNISTLKRDEQKYYFKKALKTKGHKRSQI